MVFKIILFDIDGVIIRLPEYFSSVVEKNGFKNAARILDEYYTGEENDQCLTGKKNPVVAIGPFLDRIGWKSTASDYFLQQYKYESRFVDKELLRRIRILRSKGVICFMITDQDRLRSKYLLYDLDFRNLFNESLISCQTGHLKREEECWTHLLSIIKKKYPDAELNEILFCDDTKGNIVAAQTKGLEVLHISNLNDINKLNDILDDI